MSTIMTLVSAIVIFGVIAIGTVIGADHHHDGEHHATPAGSVTDPADAPASSETPEAMLATIARAYQNAPALQDTVSIKYTLPAASGEQVYSMLFGPGKDCFVKIQDARYTALDGRLFIERENVTSKYVSRPLEGGSIVSAYRVLSNGGSMPLPQASMRYEREPAAWLEALGMSLVQNVKAVAADTGTVDGVSYDRLTLAGPGESSIHVYADQATHLIRHVHVSQSGGTYEFAMHPTVMLRLDAPIVFITAGRTQVEGPQDLLLGEGDRAPDFQLEDLNGEVVSSDSLRGSVVILDFWATWCGPCKRGLPHLAEVAKWAAAEGLPVRVFAINMGERHPDRESRLAAIGSYWRGEGFEFPTLIDFDDNVSRSYGVGPIPHSVVITPDGLIGAVKIGYDARMQQTLRAEITEALAESD